MPIRRYIQLSGLRVHTAEETVIRLAEIFFPGVFDSEIGTIYEFGWAGITEHPIRPPTVRQALGAGWMLPPLEWTKLTKSLAIVARLCPLRVGGCKHAVFFEDDSFTEAWNRFRMVHNPPPEERFEQVLPSPSDYVFETAPDGTRRIQSVRHDRYAPGFAPVQPQTEPICELCRRAIQSPEQIANIPSGQGRIAHDHCISWMRERSIMQALQR